MYYVLLKDEHKNLKRLLNNQQGNLLMVVLLTLSIGSAVFLYMMSSDRVAQSVSELKDTQSQVVLRAEISNNLSKLFSGRGINPLLCPNSVVTELKNKFANFEATAEQAQFLFDQSFTTTTPAFSNQYVRCLINPNKFSSLSISRIRWQTVRTTEPNLVSMTSDVSSSIIVMVKGSKSINKFDYSFKHRVKPRSVDDYTLIYTNYSNKKLINSSVAPVTVMGKTLLSSGATEPSLTHLISLKATEPKVTYLDTVNVSAQQIKVTDTDLVDLNADGRSLSDSIPNGIISNALTDIATLPWSDTSKFNDRLQYTYMDDFYILPYGSGNTLLKQNNEPFSNSVSNNNTNDIFGAAAGLLAVYDPPENVPEAVSKTCLKSNSGYGQFNIFVFNNINQTLTIDFTNNKNEPGNDLRKAVFCGVVAANKIIVKLNNETTPETMNNYLIGKFIVRDEIEVQGNGHLFILDGINFKNSDVQDGLPQGNLASEVSTQMYMQKFYMTQNFFLPFFYSSPTGTDAHYFKAKSISDFFASPCPAPNASKNCRNETITTPETDVILQFKDNLIYDATALD